MKYDTVLFDLDGTLLNTLEDLKDSVNFGLRSCGYPERTLEEVRSFVGNGIANLIERSIPGGRECDDYEKVFRGFKEHYSQHYMDKTVPYDGIIDLLNMMQDRGYKMAVVSNKYDEAVQKLCRKFFADCISVAVGETEGLARKPAPDTVRRALEMLHMTGEHAIYVGDSEVDVKTARNSGLDCMLVTWGFREKKDLEPLGADVMIDTVDEVMEFFA